MDAKSKSHLSDAQGTQRTLSRIPGSSPECPGEAAGTPGPFELCSTGVNKKPVSEMYLNLPKPILF